MTDIETVVVGGGPAGATAACRLAQAGREVVVLERSTAAHHKVCGEFLSIETQSILRRLRIEPQALGAVPVEHVALHAAGGRASARLPFRALSLSRCRLDEALLKRAHESGAQLRRGAQVLGVTREAGKWLIRCNDGQTLRGRDLVLATGKYGLRGIEDGRDGSLVGLKMHLRLSTRSRDALASSVELFMLDRSYVGLELIEDGIANLCLVIRRDLAQQIGSGWPALRDHLSRTSRSVAERLHDAEPLFDKPLAVVCPDGGHLTEATDPAAYRVGDRLAHIPPFTGDGLAIAVASGALAAESILRGGSPAQYLAMARAVMRHPIRFASVVSRLASNAAGRATIIAAATLVPGLIATVARNTRLSAAALPMQSRDDSYPSVRAKHGDGISARSSAG